jgi:hypothetical protein
MKAIIVYQKTGQNQEISFAWADEEHHPKPECTVCGFKIYSFWRATGSTLCNVFITIEIEPYTTGEYLTQPASYAIVRTVVWNEAQVEIRKNSCQTVPLIDGIRDVFINTYEGVTDLISVNENWGRCSFGTLCGIGL